MTTSLFVNWQLMVHASADVSVCHGANILLPANLTFVDAICDAILSKSC